MFLGVWSLYICSTWRSWSARGSWTHLRTVVINVRHCKCHQPLYTRRSPRFWVGERLCGRRSLTDHSARDRRGSRTATLGSRSPTTRRSHRERSASTPRPLLVHSRSGRRPKISLFLAEALYDRSPTNRRHCPLGIKF
jgi:hypothetical protein